MQDQPAVTPSMIKQFLQQYADDARSLALMKERLSTMEAKSGDAGTAKLTGMPRGSGDAVDTVGRALSILDTMRAAVDSAELQLADRRERAEAVINLLRDKRLPKWPEKVSLLSLKYIDAMGWPDVTEILFGDDARFWDAQETFARKTYAMHRQALEELAEITPADMLDDYD